MAALNGLSLALCVRDLPAMRDYLAAKLGFRLQNQFAPGGEGRPVVWASLIRGSAEIMLLARDYPDPPGDWVAYIWTDNADDLYNEFKASGADVVCAPEDMNYNNREFQVRLPDGRLLAFAHSLI